MFYPCHVISLLLRLVLYMCYLMSCLWFFVYVFPSFFTFLHCLRACWVCFFPFVFVFPLPCPTPGDLLAGLSKFAKLARSVTRSKTLVSQFSSHPVSIKDSTRHVQSHLAHVSTTAFNRLCNLYNINKYHVCMSSSSLWHVDIIKGLEPNRKGAPKNL